MKFTRQMYNDKCNLEELDEYKRKYRKFNEYIENFEMESKETIQKLNATVMVYANKYTELYRENMKLK